MNALLLLRGLRKHYGERMLFDIDTLVIGEASAYVLTGMNGTGKSTLWLRPSPPSRRSSSNSCCARS